MCRGTNHFAACCKKGPQVKEVREDHDTFDILDLKIDSVGNHADWIIHAEVADQPVVLKVDTGSQANLLSYSIYRRCRDKANLKPSGSVLRSYSGDAIKHIGVATLQVVMDNRSGDIDFFIASEALGLVSRSVSVVNTSNTEKIVTEFHPLFQGTGCLARQYRMVLRNDATPVVQPARVPLALREPLREELERMERADIIRKVNGPTDWVSPLIIVRKKDGKLRVCMDPRRINECLKREHYQMPKREDIEDELAGAKYFSRRDANSGFLQIPLDEDTSAICTFGTPFGRYQFLRLQFGIASAPEVFQKTLSEIFDPSPGVRAYIDDILIWGSTKEEHNSRLKNALQLASRAGLTFNAAK